MIALLYHHIIPAAYSVLPLTMQSREATAMLLAIACQESDQLRHRRQMAGGPARGFWQFESGVKGGGGITGVMKHPSSKLQLRAALDTLVYSRQSTATQLHAAIEHNDVLAAVLARLLLWTLPDRLPTVDEPLMGWSQYLDAWRPGKPHPATWPENYKRAWDMVNLT